MRGRQVKGEGRGNTDGVMVGYYYDNSTGLLPLRVLPQIPKETPQNVSQHDTAHLLEYRENYGKRARQRSVMAETTKDTTGALSQYMYNKEYVRDSNEEFDFGSFGKETEFETVDIETDNWPTKPQSKGSIYSQSDILVLC